MNIIDFTKIGGYRLKQATLRKLQEAYFYILKSFIGFLNIPDTGNYVISGCVTDGTNITPGIMYIDGELCPFAGSLGNGFTKIKKNVEVNSLVFKNGVAENVFRKTTAIVSTEGNALNTFNRLFPVFDENYVHTDNNYTDEEKLKLEGLDNQVQTDWNETDPDAPGYLLNRPTGNLMTYLYKGSINIGNPTTDDVRTITFPTVGTTAYFVLGSLRSNSASGNDDNDVFWVWKDPTATSFKLWLREVVDFTQDLTFYYTIIPI